MADDAATQPQFRNQRSDDFTSAYSNNVSFEASVWDLKIIFGELDQSAGVIEQHTAITVPWAIAKLAVYYLGTQIAAHEVMNGKIAIPQSVMAPPPPPLTGEQRADPNMKKVYEEFTRLYEAFIKGV